MLSSLFEVDVCSLTSGGEQTRPDREKGGRSGGPVGVPKGPDCTGSTVTESLRSGAACADPQALEPAGHAREKLQAAIGRCQIQR